MAGKPVLVDHPELTSDIVGNGLRDDHLLQCIRSSGEAEVERDHEIKQLSGEGQVVERVEWMPVGTQYRDEAPDLVGLLPVVLKDDLGPHGVPENYGSFEA